MIGERGCLSRSRGVDPCLRFEGVGIRRDFDQTPSFLELISLEQALEAALGLKVDLATEAGLRPSVRARIAADAVDV